MRIVVRTMSFLLQLDCRCCKRRDIRAEAILRRVGGILRRKRLLLSIFTYFAQGTMLYTTIY